MKKKVLLAMLGLPVVAGLGGCSTLRTTVIPGENHYTVVATAKDGPTAIHGAVKKATQTCATTQGKLVVLKQETIYQGSGKELGQATEIASEVAFQVGGPYIPSTRQSDDYKTTMIFKCT